uniref:Peptidase M14 domain-containing protein n=1 Tax=Megaselia scalaris TaxID=36166 RepID=T1GWZ9_MEGSC
MSIKARSIVYVRLKSLRMWKLLCIFLGVFQASSGERVRYDNYHAYEVKAENMESLEFLRSLESSSERLLFLNNVQLIGQSAFVFVAPEKVSDFEDSLNKSNIPFELKSSNAQNIIQADEDDLLKPRSAEYDWTEYHDLEETYSWMESLAAKYPQVTVVEGGRTYEGQGNPGIVIEAGIHSREWIACTTATFMINELLNSSTTSVREVAENYDWYIFPHLNPDGFAYTRNLEIGDRMWRRTRSKQANGCIGVDANRNWDFHWREIGASGQPCLDDFAGPAPFSEIETKTFADYIRSLKGQIRLYISLHSWSQLLMYPYGHTQRLPVNVEDYRQITNAAIQAMAKRYGTKYIGGNIYDAIYPASGTSIDWVFGTQGVKLTFTYELRPSGHGAVTFSHDLPKEFIIPTAEETVDSIVALVNEAKKLKYFD